MAGRFDEASVDFRRALDMGVGGFYRDHAEEGLRQVQQLLAERDQIAPAPAAGLAPSLPGDTLSEMQTEPRRALVIGNSNYRPAIGSLRNPANDARDVAAALRAAGFAVNLKFDLSRDETLRVVIEFARTLRDGVVGLFYYAGHALQKDGANYLIPVGAQIDDPDLVEVEAMNLDQVLWHIGSADNRLNIVVLDARRDNPFARNFRSLRSGLAQTPAPRGVLIVYATTPGDVASDGTGRNSPFTAAWLSALREPGLKLEEVFKVTRASVVEATDARQLPWTNSSVIGDFHFHLPPGAAASR